MMLYAFLTTFELMSPKPGLLFIFKEQNALILFQIHRIQKVKFNFLLGKI